MATPPDTIEFVRGDVARVVGVMDRFAAEGEGSGWINIAPALTDDDAARVPPRSGLAAWFSGRGPAVPLGTWMPPVVRGRPRAAQVGMEHGTGPNALARLSDAGVELPTGWVKRQDHAKHGIVIELPPAVDHAAVLDWVMAAATALSPVVAVGPRWVAAVHRSV